MRITKISIEDYLGIGFFKTDKLGKLNRITGGNGVGKSAVLKAITEAFRSSGVDPNLIKIDSDKAEIIVELDEKILIQRKNTPTANNVKVVHDGQPLDRPQKWLNSLLGGFQFNPVDFLLAKAKQRREILLSAMPFSINADKLLVLIEQIAGNDSINAMWQSDEDYESYIDSSKHGLEVLADIQKHVYDRRHEQGIEVDRLKKSIAQDRKDIPETLDQKKFAGFNLMEATDELSRMNQQITRNEADLVQLDNLRTRAEQIDNEIEILEKQIKALKAERSEVQQKGKALREKTDEFKRPDIESLRKSIEEYQQFQKYLNRLEEIERREGNLEQSESVHKALDGLHKALVNEIPKKLLAELELPIEGLEIKGDNIFINGVQIDKISSSEQIKFSVEIARALAGELKVICIDRFETLDNDSRKEFEKLASKDDYEYFLTVVTSGDLKMESENGQAEPAKNKSKSKVEF